MSDVLSSIEKMSYKSGDFIFFEGDVENHFYIVESGEVRIYTKDNTGKRIPICDIKEGESFGEFALISEMPRSASAQATSNVVVIKVSEDVFKQLLADLPAWAESMLKSFVDRLQDMTEKIRELEQDLKRHEENT